MSEVSDRLRLILAAANCTITNSSKKVLQFKHGTYLTQSAPLFPKTGSFQFTPSDKGTHIDYQVALAPPAALWLTILGALLCWLVFPAIIAYRAITVHPRQMMENFLAAL